MIELLMSSRAEKIENGVRLVCDKKDSFLYAFYLDNKKGIEKKFYSEENSYESNWLTKGLNVFTFYVKDKSGHREHLKLYYVLNSSEELNRIEMSVIAENHNYKIVHYNLEADITFVVFNGLGSTKNTRAFGLDYLLQKNFNVIVVLQDNNNQYQDLSLNSFKEFVEPHVEGKKIYYYGSSLGGYCALYYANSIQGTVIAGAPRNSCHPVIKEKFNYNKKLLDGILFRHEKNLPKKNDKDDIYIFYDPLVKIDNFYINNYILKSYPKAKVYEIKFAGHPVFYHLNKTGQLEGIINHIVEKKHKPLRIDYTKESEFIYYEKMKSSYSSVIENIEKIESINKLHPLIKEKTNKIKRKLYMGGEVEKQINKAVKTIKVERDIKPVFSFKDSMRFQTLSHYSVRNEGVNGLPTYILDNKNSAYLFAKEIGVNSAEVFFYGIRMEEAVENLNYPSVLKPTHSASGIGVFICYSKDNFLYLNSGQKFNSKNALLIFAQNLLDSKRIVKDSWMSENLLLSNKTTNSIARDIKFYIFYGRIGLILETKRIPEIKRCWLDSSLQKVKTGKYDNQLFYDNEEIPNDLIQLAKKVSKKIPSPFVRIDFLVSEGQYYLGEFTPAPEKYWEFTEEWNIILGKYYQQACMNLINDISKGKHFYEYLNFINKLNSVIR